MDFYDTMLDTIQDFPLEAKRFERNIKRLNSAYARYMAKYKKLLERMPDPSHPPFMMVRRHLEKCIKQKKKVIKTFLKYLNIKASLFAYCNKEHGNVVEMKKIAPTETSIFQTKDNILLEAKHCVCGSTDGGLMICCDSPSCPIRWHHFKCIGMTTAPTSGWICGKCKKLE